MNDTPQRILLFEEVRDKFSQYYNVTDKDLNNKMFIQPQSNRLTAWGCSVLGQIYTNYVFDYNQPLKPKHLLAIARNIKFPFFINDQKLILFSSEDAFLLKICANDVNLWTERISQ